MCVCVLIHLIKRNGGYMNNCHPKRRSLLVLSNSVTVRTLWHATPLWTESGQARRPWQRTKLAGFWPDVWPHGILTNISWTRTVAGALLCMRIAHRLASTRIWPISSQAWPFVLHCLAWNGLALLSCFYISMYTIGFLWLVMQSPAGTNELLISW